MRRPHDEDPSPRRTSRRGPCRPPTGACRPPGIPSTSRNTSRRQCLRGGTVRRCSPRRVVLPARCGFSPPPSTADEAGAECPSALVLPALCPVRISVSSSLLAATMNQKSSLREVPQFVSWLLTGNTENPRGNALFGVVSATSGLRRLDGGDDLDRTGCSPPSRRTGLCP